MNVDYLVFGRVTEQCWHEAKDATRVFGKYEVVEEAADLNEVFESIQKYFTEHQVAAGDWSRLVSVSEHDGDTGLTSERIFTASDIFGDRQRAIGEVHSIARALVENGQRRASEGVPLTR